jgi:hypothetical protein
MLNKKLIILTFFSVLLGLFVLSACAKQESEKSQLPEKALQAINKAYADATITEVEKENEDGKEVYEVELKTDGREIEVEVTADGKILSSEDEDKDDDDEDEDENEIEFNFDKDAVNSLPAEWSNQKTGKGGLGVWTVLADKTAPSKPNVLAQTSKKNPGYHFNVAVAEETNFSNLEIELKFNAVDGQEDQGGGPVWRYQDADNYYICRANPLESNYRFYKVVNGNRKQLASAKVEIPSNVWHEIKVKNVGNHIQCWLDGKLYLDMKDDTFKSGKVGLWTKADAVTYFDDFEIEEED